MMTTTETSPAGFAEAACDSRLTAATTVIDPSSWPSVAPVGQLASFWGKPGGTLTIRSLQFKDPMQKPDATCPYEAKESRAGLGVQEIRTQGPEGCHAGLVLDAEPDWGHAIRSDLQLPSGGRAGA